MKTRIEKIPSAPSRSPGPPVGRQTQRSLHFFAISTEKMPAPLVTAMAQLKRAPPPR